MGWASGSELMNGVIGALNETKLDAKERQVFYKKVIAAFEDRDWDTQDECLGSDSAFDAAMRELQRDWYT